MAKKSSHYTLSRSRLLVLLAATVALTIALSQVDYRQLLGSANDDYAQLWQEFCDELKKSGSAVEFYSPDDSEIDRAEGYRFLTRTLRLSLLSELEHKDPLRPVIWQSETPTRKFGGNNPDEFYFDAYIDGSNTYRIHGQRGSTPLIEITVYEGRLRSGERGKHGAHLTEENLIVGDDGSVEIILSPEPHSGNWIKTTPDTDFLFIRQYRFDWEQHKPAQLKIDLLNGEPGPPPPLTLQEMREKLMAVASSLEFNASFWPKLSRLAAVRTKNAMMEPFAKDGKGNDAEAQDVTLPQGHILQAGFFDLAPNEAMVLRFTPPKTLRYWGFQLLNRWYESLDYRYSNVHTNNYRAQAGANGEVTLVVSSKDPGVDNWIDTTGHRQGTMLFRWTRPEPGTELPDIRVDVLPLAEVAKTVQLGSTNP